MKKPKVSIIIPLYNQKKYITQAIESTLNQTYRNIEIIVVDDGSTDSPGEIINKFKGKIKLYVHKQNKGPSLARNTGIKNSTGEYLQFLDGDDYLKKDKIEKQLEFMQKTKADISYCEVERLYEESGERILGKVGEIKKEDFFAHLYNSWQKNPAPTHSWLLKREVAESVGGFDKNLRAAEDPYFLVKVTFTGKEIKYFPYLGCVYRKHHQSMTEDRYSVMKNIIKYYKKINQYAGEEFIKDKFGYSGYQMMCANVTYIYAYFVKSRVGWSDLKRIKELIKTEGIKFNTDPIPLSPDKFKSPLLFLEAYLQRWHLPLKLIKRPQ